jgi:selenocysteine lyase/cysteine desulfurase
MGLEWMQSVGMSNIRVHTSSLIAWITSELKALKWDNGAPFCFIPEPEEGGGEPGSSVSALVLDRNGKVVPHRVMEARTAAAKFALRTGCFCNPGSGFLMLGWLDARLVADAMLVSNFKHDYDAFSQAYASKGLVRVSVGIPTTFADVYRLLRFFQTEILAKPEELEAQIKTFMDTLEIPYSVC